MNFFDSIIVFLFCCSLLNNRLECSHIRSINKCPLTKNSWQKRGEQFQCSLGEYYHCVSMVNKTFVEGCLLPYFMPGEGSCPFLEFNEESIVWHFEHCTQAPGCPQSNWYSNEMYLYPKCLVSRRNGEETTWFTRGQTIGQTHTLQSKIPTGVEDTFKVHRENPTTTLSTIELTSYVHIGKEPGWPKFKVLLVGGLILLVLAVVFVVTCIVLKRTYLNNLSKIDYMPRLKPIVRPRELVREVNLDIYAEIEETRRVTSECNEGASCPRTNSNESKSDDLEMYKNEKIQVQVQTMNVSEVGVNENRDNEEETPQQRNHNHWKGLEIL